MFDFYEFLFCSQGMTDKPSLAEVMTRGREERRKAEVEKEAKKDVKEDAEGNMDSSNEEDFTMIAETPEMVSGLILYYTI